MFLAALLLAQTATPTPTCPAVPAALPADLAGWRTSAASLASFKAVSLPTADARAARLADVPAPDRPGRMVLAPFRVTRAGTYGIALDQQGWIDLYRAGGRTPLASAAHGHGPDCSGIRKIVRFVLVPGAYRVLVSALTAPRAKLMLVRD